MVGQSDAAAGQNAGASSGDSPEADSPDRSRVRASRRISIVWIIPAVAILIGAWLAWSTLAKEGPTITISFETAEGLQAGQSQLKFKDITLGTVRTITLSEDNSHVLVKVATTAAARRLLTDGTVFWVVKPRLFAGSLSGLSTLFSGSYIAMLPGREGQSVKSKFVGLEDPPVLQAAIPGRQFLLKSTRLGSISVGSPVFFRDLNVGEVLGWDIGEMANNVTIHAFVREPFDKYVNDQSRFWNASGVSIKLGGSGVDVQLESLRALLLGGVAFDTPPTAGKPPPSAENHLFPLFASREAADAASYSRKIPLLSYFTGSVRGLAAGSDVTMHGLKVGTVTGVRLTFNPETDKVLARVHYEVEPERVLGVGNLAFQTPEEGAKVLLSKGLRAALQSANLLTGQQMVALEFVPDAPPARLVEEGAAIVLPTQNGGSFSGIQSAAAELLQKVNSIPFESIGQDLGQLVKNLNRISDSPQVKQTLSGMASAMAAAEVTLKNLDKGITPAAQRLPEIAATLQKTLANANGLLSSLDTGYGDNTRFNRDLGRLLVELDDAARSIKALADLLTRHPEALIKGRPQGGVQ